MKYTNLIGFKKHLEGSATHHFSNLYLIIAKDSFQRREGIDILLSFLLGGGEKVKETSVKKVEGEGLTKNQLQEELNVSSLFSKKQVFLIQGGEKIKKTEMNFLESYLEKPNRAVHLIIAMANSPPPSFYRKAEKEGVILDIPEEKPWEKERSLVNWLGQKVQAKGKAIDLQTCQYLVKELGIDRALLAQEVEKLVCYVGDRREITVGDVHSLCHSIPPQTVWQLGEALFHRQAPSAMHIAKNLLQQGVPFLVLLKQIRSQFQTEYQVFSILAGGGSPSDVTKHFPYMKGYVLERHLQMTQKCGEERLKKGILEIDATDIQAKNGSTDPELLLELLIAKLTK